jgi:hypothetical protein
MASLESKFHHLELVNKLIEVQPHSAKKFLDELIALAGDPRGLRDVDPTLGSMTPRLYLAFFPPFTLGRLSSRKLLSSSQS